MRFFSTIKLVRFKSDKFYQVSYSSQLLASDRVALHRIQSPVAYTCRKLAVKGVVHCSVVNPKARVQSGVKTGYFCEHEPRILQLTMAS